MTITKNHTNIKIPGESVRNKPLHDSHGKIIGKILDVVYSADHKKIEHGVIELDKEMARGTTRRDIAWDAVRFDDHGEASLTDEAGADLLVKPQGKAKKTMAEKETQEAAEVDFFDNRQRPI